jgi:large subunit ribosomal protein L7/L12
MVASHFFNGKIFYFHYICNFKLMSKLESILNELKTLTLMDTADLVKQIEETFNVNATPVGSAMVPVASTEVAEKVEEKTTFDLTLEDVASDKRVAVLKIIRKLTSVGLAEAKAFTTSLPKVLKEGITKEEAEEAKTALEEAGAKVSIS